MIQKLSLKDFEHNISPSTWDAADDLVQAGRVKNLREVERHFWVASVETDEGNYEAEVMITPHKIKAYACECFTEGRRLMCPHIAATLLKIRQFYEQREEARRAKAEQKPPSELTRFTVQTALENASPENLNDFVRDYARRDRDFSLALKTRFAANMTEAENPYALVLDSVLPKPAAKTKISEPDFRRLRKVLDGLEEQLALAQTLGDFRGTFQISSAIFLRINPLLAKAEGNRRSVLLHFCQKSFDSFGSISTSAPSPELRETVWEMLFNLGTTSLFPPEMEREAMRFLSESATDEAKFGRLREMFDHTPHPAPAFVLQLFLAAQAARKMPEAAVRVLADYADKPDMVKAAFLQLYYLHHWEAATLVGEHFLGKNIFPPVHSRELENVLLYIAEQTGDRPRQAALLRQRFLLTGSSDVFEKLKTAASKRWLTERKTLLAELRTKSDWPKTAAILSSEGDLENLADLIENHGDLTMLQRYEAAFLLEKKEFVQARYSAFLSQYLEEHFGTPAAQHVRLRLSDLLHKGETDMVIQIIRELTARFPERLSLPAELAELFPRSKRKMI
ncbi:MAG: SWIM zinc finger domain-containing protein [Saprospiraceae bacterium]